jgi:hypothetical protein
MTNNPLNILRGFKMKYGVVKLENNGISSYNLGTFKKEEEIILFPMKSLQVEIMRIKYYLEKSGEMVENATRNNMKYKKREISKAKYELEKASATIDSIMKFEMQTSLENFKWPEKNLKKKKRIYKHKSDVPALVGI